MFGLIREKSINKILTATFIAGLKAGTKVGIQMGRMQAGDKGIIVSARVQYEIEKIIESSERQT